jgi:hypothetical protein
MVRNLWLLQKCHLCQTVIERGNEKAERVAQLLCAKRKRIKLVVLKGLFLFQIHNAVDKVCRVSVGALYREYQSYSIRNCNSTLKSLKGSHSKVSQIHIR